MPATYNGIGTHYYGMKNVTKKRKVCTACGNETIAKSYDTREFFVVFFIPIIPLRKYRIMDECTSWSGIATSASAAGCTNHSRMRYSDFLLIVDDDTKEETAILENDPENIDALERLAEKLIEWGVTGRAKQTLETVIDKAPERANAQFRMGLVEKLSGKHKRSLPFFQEAINLDTENAGYRTEYGEALIDSGKREEGAAELEQSIAVNPPQARVLALLASNYQKMKQWDNAYVTWQKFLALDPAALEDKVAMKRLKKCGRKSGRKHSQIEAETNELKDFTSENQEILDGKFSAHTELENSIVRNGKASEAIGYLTDKDGFETVIKKGSRLPAKSNFNFTFFGPLPNEIRAAIPLLKRRSRFAKSESMGYYIVHDDGNTASKRDIRVLFDLSEDGGLKVSAQDMETRERVRVTYSEESPWDE